MTAPDRRRLALVAVLLPLLAGGGIWAWSRWATPPAPAPVPARVAPPVPPPVPPVELGVLALSGEVEAGASDDAWRPLAAGDVLRADQRLRTGAGASVELSTGTGSHLAVGELTQLSIRELSAAVHAFRLSRGLVRVDYQPDGDRRVRIEEASGGAVAETRGASFHVAANGLAFAVATRTGSVSLSAAGATVTLGEGEQSLAEAGRAPDAPRPIPVEILLKVARASSLPREGRCLDTVGRSEPGALVTLDGAPVPVGPDGRFPVRVDRRTTRAIELKVVTPGGRVATQVLACSAGVDDRIKDINVRWKRGQP